MSEYQILQTINSPKDLDGLSVKELEKLAEEIRDFLIYNVSKTGGHFASNMGIVDLTLALHKTFDSPNDKFIFDVGHQSYTHKILTGRRDRFSTNRQFGGLSGFTRRYESEHDFIDAGHASTSISSALGISLGEELQGKSNYIIPIIGDAGLTGGMAYEALNHLGHLKKKFIVILNDNNMSIDNNIGGISYTLSKMTTTKSYQAFKQFADYTMLHIPLIGKPFYNAVMRLKKSLKTFFYKSNIFTDLGVKYIGPIDGHNIKEMIKVLERVKLLDEPVLLHVVTKKGKGYKPAEDNPGDYHGVKPFDPKVGVVSKPGSGVPFTKAFTNSILELAEKDDKIVAITAAMMTGTGLTPFFKKYPTRSFDVGITEEHAVTLAAGLAISGMKPVVSIYSTFIQRSIDQIIHDISIPGLDVLFTLDRAGIVPADGEAHQGLFDIAILKSIPGAVIMSPSTEYEMASMLNYGLNLKGPTFIRYAKDNCLEEDGVINSPLIEGEGVLYKNNSSNIIITYGECVRDAKKAVDILEESNIKCDILALRFLSPLNQDYIKKTLDPYKNILFVEDGVIKGGVGQDVRSIINRPIKIIGIDSNFLTHGSRSELKELSKIDPISISNIIKEGI